MQRGVELDRPDHGYCFAGCEVAVQCRKEVLGVDGDIDEDVEGLDLCDIHGDEAGMGIVDEEVAAEGAGGVVVDAAGAVGDVSHDDCFNAWAELGEDVGDGGGEEEEAFRHLEGYFGGAVGADAVDGLVEFERVIRGEEGDGGVDVGVIEDLGRDLV